MSTNKHIPKAYGSFLLGNFKQIFNEPGHTFYDWYRNYGDLVSFRIANRKFYLLSHPSLFEQALIKQNDIFVKDYDPKKPFGLSLVLGQGLLTSQGNFWQKQRRIMQPVFQKGNINSLLPQVVTAGKAMLARWRQLGEGAEINVHNEMMGLTLDVITQTMFSTSVLEQMEPLAPCMDTVVKYAARSTVNPFLLPLYIPTAENKKFKHALAVLDDVIYGIINQRLASPSKHNDLLDMLLNARDNQTGEKMTDQQLRDEVMTIFCAGHETTANLLSWTLYLLGRHPHILAKLYQEITDTLQDRTPTVEDLHKLEYTKAVLNESLRLRPPAAIVLRKLIKDTQLDGYSLKAGRMVLLSIFNLHHHVDFWPQPEQFNPERFLNAESRRFSFMPFGTGERICIGNHFAMMESQLLLAMMVQHCDLQLLSDEEVEIEMSVTLRPKGGVPARIVWR